MKMFFLAAFAWVLFVSEGPAQEIIDRFPKKNGFALALGEQRFLELFRSQFPNAPSARIRNINVGTHAAEFEVSLAPGAPFKPAWITTLLGGTAF